MSGGVQEEVSEPFAGLEVRDFLRGHLNKGIHLRIPPSPSPVLAHPEASEPSQLNLVSLHQGIGDAIKDRLEDCCAVLLCQAGDFRQLVDQLRLRHRSNPLRLFTTRGALTAEWEHVLPTSAALTLSKLHPHPHLEGQRRAE